MTIPMVTVYDTETETTHRIPMCELAPDMVRARVPHRPDLGEVFVDGKKFKQGTTYYYGPFTDPELLDTMQWLSSVFAGVNPLTPEEWEDGFRRDPNMEKEMATWVSLAVAYLYFTKHLSDRADDLPEKRDIFVLLLSCATSGPDAACAATNSTTLSQLRKRAIVEQVKARAYKPNKDTVMSPWPPPCLAILFWPPE